MTVTTIQFHLLCGLMLGFEYVEPEAAGAHSLVIDILFLRILIQHGEVEDME